MAFASTGALRVRHQLPPHPYVSDGTNTPVAIDQGVPSCELCRSELNETFLRCYTLLPAAGAKAVRA